MKNIKPQFSLSFKEFKETILNDYKLAFQSRECSILGRKEVFTGKAKFGIFGDGKELPQVAISKVFKNGDFRSGYYRDQTISLGIGDTSIYNFFAQLYSDTNVERDPASAGRQMSCHFATRLIDDQGNWKNITESKNNSADISCTAGQMPRIIGLALASKVYKQEEKLHSKTNFSKNGSEIVFGTIGDASVCEGHFWEALNTVCALKLPVVLSIWDDAYGISVPSDKQRGKKNISDLLEGFKYSESEKKGCQIITVKGWDYPELVKAYVRAEKWARQYIPVVVHVTELTQPQGHSSSGSHERYKSEERLNWEKEHDCLYKFKEWILNFSVSSSVKLTNKEEIKKLEEEAKKEVRDEMLRSRKDYSDSITDLKEEAIPFIKEVADESSNKSIIEKEIKELENIYSLYKRDIYSKVRKILRIVRLENIQTKEKLQSWLLEKLKIENNNYSSHLYSESELSSLKVKKVDPIYNEKVESVDGRVLLRNNFDALFEKYPELLAFGEDIGFIGDVNQGMEGLQEKFGKTRIADTGIREATIIGQGIGLAMRGLRPIAEIQYLDYVYYALQTMTDDLACLHYRTKGGQKAPVIIRTRGHRLEGIWHSGSPMGTLIHSLRGLNILVPRDFVKAAGFYNTMLQSDDPCLIIECLNGYRLKEDLPVNLGEFTTPVGEVEVTKEGKDITVVTYGATWKLVTEAAEELGQLGIDIEVIDVQSLLPLDINHDILKSIKKTNRLVVIDEDVPGGASSYIMQKVLEEQGGFRYLDSIPKTITAKDHRPAYASDGDYFSKPSLDDIIEGIYSMMYEINPKEFPKFI